MWQDGSYDDQITVQTFCDIYDVNLAVITNLDPEGRVDIRRQSGSSLQNAAIGHFTEFLGEDYVFFVNGRTTLYQR